MSRVALRGFQVDAVEFQLVGRTGMTERVKDHFRQTHLADTGIGFRLFPGKPSGLLDSGACVRQKRREDMVDILFAKRPDCTFGGARQFLFSVPTSGGTYRQ